jgi:hypothetical protein
MLSVGITCCCYAVATPSWLDPVSDRGAFETLMKGQRGAEEKRERQEKRTPDAITSWG